MVSVVGNGCKKWQFLSLPVFLLLPLVCFAGAGTLTLQKKASFDGRLDGIPASIKSDCQLETKLIDFIESFARDGFEKITLVDTASPATPGKALRITITDLSCSAGGAWSGPKHLTIEGTLWQDGRIIGTFTANRVTGGAAWGTYKGTCSLLGRCARTLGRDVATWLEKPTMNARLGDAP